jgi:PAS domain S-box-containing protein
MDMSAEQHQHAPVRLLIAERSENAAHQFDSLLRDAGIATRLEVVDLPMAVEKLPHADMMLCNAGLPELHQLLPRLTSTAPSVPIIVVNNDEASLTQSEGMELGAADVVSDVESRHLVLVVKRELEHVCQRIQYHQMKKALNEAEQRCQLLLQSSRAAIAYVHEGMHIYANEGYLNLFGFESADDLLGLPLIDLLDGDSIGTLKEKLRQFRGDGQETGFDFVGHSTSGTRVEGNMTFAAAEYEGEHCIQVVVRAAPLTLPEAGSNEAQPDETDESVPVLDTVVEEESGTRDAKEESPKQDAEPATANGAARAADEDAADQGAGVRDGVPEPENRGTQSDAEDKTTNVVEFKLELEEEGEAQAAAAEAAAEAEAETELGQEVELDFGIDDVSPEEAQSAAEGPAHAEDDTAEHVESLDQTLVGEDHPAPSGAETETPAPAAGGPVHVHRKNGPAQGLGEFLNRCESAAAGHEGRFISIFVAQIDAYEDMQRSFGLAGVEDACRFVESKLLDVVDGPFMQISPYQWALLVCDQTREDALARVDGYRTSVESMMFEIREKTVRPSCSFGGAILNMQGFDSISTALEATLNNAFTTLRSALESSDGNTIELPDFENPEQEYGDEANRVLALISEAIENQSFTLLFQPIISLRGDSDEHYEVFLRMSDRQGNLMAPSQFLKTAIDHGVAGKIDRWVILQSIKMLSAHRANGHNTRLTINLTTNSVTDPEFVQWLGVAIKAARLPSDAVIFQVTEHDANTYVRQTREFVEGLKNLHCRSSLSRFGRQADPFDVLSHIPVDFVKIDGSLIQSVERDPEQKEAVKNMVRELQNVGKLTIVPMVESASLLSTLWQAGVNYIQGHYLQEPSTKMDYDFSTDD